jgi:hypothetical protein
MATRVQFTKGGSTVAVSLVMSSNVTAGNFLVVVVNTGNIINAGSYAVSDTLGNVWTQIKNVNFPDVNGNLSVFTATVAASGPDTISVAFGGSGAVNAFAIEYTALSAWMVDVSNSHIAESSGTGTISPGSITTTAAPEISLSAVMSDADTATWAVDSGMSLLGQNSLSFPGPFITTLAVADLPLAAIQTLTPTWSGGTGGGVDSFATLVISFTGSAPAPGPSKLEISLFGTKRFGRQKEEECVEFPEPPKIKLFGVE